jgi:hypothetical protein
MSIHARNYSNNPMETKVAIDEKGPHYYLRIMEIIAQ